MLKTIFRLFVKGIKDLFHDKWQQLLTLMAVTLVTLLGGLFLLVIHNIHLQILKNQGQIKFEIFWNNQIAFEDIQSQWQKIQNLPMVQSLKTYQPNQALQVLSESMGKDIDLNWLQNDNPIPPTAVVEAKLPRQDSALAARDLYQRLKQLSGVKKVTFNPFQADLASSWTKISTDVMWLFIVFLAVLVGLIVGNTFKLSQMNRREEIEVLRLVGAARWYIQLPLLVGAAIQALIGGLLAVGFLKLFQSYLEKLLNIPPIWLKINFLSLDQIGGLLLILVLVSIMSSWVAIRR